MDIVASCIVALRIKLSLAEFQHISFHMGEARCSVLGACEVENACENIVSMHVCIHVSLSLIRRLMFGSCCV